MGRYVAAKMPGSKVEKMQMNNQRSFVALVFALEHEGYLN
jgi:hypothetical protein